MALVNIALKWKFRLVWATVFFSMLLGCNRADAWLLQASSITPADSRSIATLADGSYQVCNQPNPKDGRDGVGVCFVFTKTGDRVDGYYGYPYSDHFICIQGNVHSNTVTGQALAISWAGNQWSKISPSNFFWDAEQRLTLSQGKILRTSGSNDDRTDWILFRQASLNLSNFYPYGLPRMKAASELCDWQ